jgi:hypothetical protein
MHWRPILLLALLRATAYRIEDPASGPPNTTAHFRPYDRGFVGRVANPASPRPWRVNPGNPWSHAKPNVFRGVLPRQNCSGMVGPVGGIYFCSSPAAGYCDRRSGACFCSAGYSGADCGICRPTHVREPLNGTCVARLPCPNGCSGAGACDAAGRGLLAAVVPPAAPLVHVVQRERVPVLRGGLLLVAGRRRGGGRRAARLRALRALRPALRGVQRARGLHRVRGPAASRRAALGAPPRGPAAALG